MVLALDRSAATVYYSFVRQACACLLASLQHGSAAAPTPVVYTTPPPAASTALCCTSCTYMQSDICRTAHHVSCLQSKRLFPAIPDAIRGQWLVAATSGTSTALLPPQALSLLQLQYFYVTRGDEILQLLPV